MSGEPLGTLQVDDPLYEFLLDRVLRETLGVRIELPVFDVYRLDGGSNWVFRYCERSTGLSLVCKFYGRKPLFDGWIGDRALRARLMMRELESLERARALGFDRPPYRVVRPLAASRELSCVLVEEYAPGIDLDEYLARAIHRRESRPLLERLGAVAGFLAELHNRSASPQPVDGGAALARLETLIASLAARRTIPPDQIARLDGLRRRWAASRILDSGRTVLIFGDVGPSHFVFDGAETLTAIDLEVLTSGDRAEDLGRMMAELKHRFLRDTGDPWAGEPYIRELCASYGRRLPAGEEDLGALTNRARFHMAYYAASIGRNFTVPLDYRRRLIDEAEACLAL